MAFGTLYLTTAITLGGPNGSSDANCDIINSGRMEEIQYGECS